MRTSNVNIKLNHAFFARNRHREKEYDNIFSNAHKSMAFLSNIIFLTLFPPVIAISNLFSSGVFLSLMNISLSIGYCAKSIQRLKEGEVSQLELVTSLFFLGLSLAITFHLAPAISLVNLVEVIGFINIISTGINSFFLIRNLVLPPVQTIIQHVLTSLGYEIKAIFFNKAPFSLEHDRPVLDRLLRKFYQHDSFSEEFKETHIQPFNNILSTLSRYINKYNEPFFGNLLNHDRINHLETAVSQLIIHGNTDSSTVFIHRKIDFKCSKLNVLKQSRDEIISEKKLHFHSRFFIFSKKIPETEQAQTKDKCLALLTEEIDRQSKKIELLKACIP